MLRIKMTIKRAAKVCSVLSLTASASGAQLPELWRFDPIPGLGLSQFLSRNALVGDVDGDGARDVLVFAGGGFGGWVLSAKTGRLAIPPLICRGPDPEGIDGEDMGDFDGDGVPDIGMGFREAGPVERGQFDVFSGADSSILMTYPNPFPMWANFGAATPIGDLTGDGVTEVCFSWDSLQLASVRLAFVVDLTAGEILHAHRQLIDDLGATVSAIQLGQAVGTPLPDYALWVDSIGPPILGSISSRLSVYDGETHEEAYWRWFSRVPIARGAGDIDRDGVEDIVLSNNLSGPFQCGTLPYPGSEFVARVVSGADLETLLTIPYTRDIGFASTCLLKELTGGLGDLNGDGIPEIVGQHQGSFSGGVSIDASGIIYSGRTGTMLQRFPSEIFPIVLADFTGDGYGEVLTIYDEEDVAILRAGAPGDAERVCTSTVNSSGSAARLSPDGPISVSSNELNFAIEGGVPNEMAVLFCGPEIAQLPAGDGFLCVAPGSTGLLRLSGPLQLDGDGVLLHRIDMTQGAIGSGGPFAWEAGSRWVVQAQIRDPLGPGGTGFTFTDAIDLTLMP